MVPCLALRYSQVVHAKVEYSYSFEQIGGMDVARKTKLMQRVEDEHQRPLEKLLPEMVNDIGLSATADTLGVSKATLGYWLLKLGISVRRVALAPGETLEVKRVS